MTAGPELPPTLGTRLRRYEMYRRVPDFLELWSRRTFAVTAVGAAAVIVLLGGLWWPVWLLVGPWLVLVGIGVRDIFQRHHAVLRNYPLLGHLRYVAESIRPEVRQYFVESDHELTPFARADRAIVYQRSKGALETMPFGTRQAVYAPGYEFVNHSMFPARVADDERRVTIGLPGCAQPYSASRLNVSAMSYGSLSSAAVRALNLGAKAGGFYQNTGEGGISPYHQEGGDLVWQIGTGYFGCRRADGHFDPARFRDTAANPLVKMIELKLSQGAKPAHGGILPGAKVTEEIARIRGVPVGRDVDSPPGHRAFDGPRGLMTFLAQLRELSGGKPVGFKLCVGNPVELMAVCHAMRVTGIRPDFVTVDGGEGGTGAAPAEFSDFVGAPLDEGLTLVHGTLIGAGLRDGMRLISAGKIATGFHMVRQMALGADLCNAARTMLFALGCIQALKCNTNRCPVGVTTQDPALMAGLDVPSKAERVHSFHDRTVHAAMELVGALGLTDPDALRPYHISRRVDPTRVLTLADLYPTPEPGAYLEGAGPPALQKLWDLAALRA